MFCINAAWFQRIMVDNNGTHYKLESIIYAVSNYGRPAGTMFTIRSEAEVGLQQCYRLLNVHRSDVMFHELITSLVGELDICVELHPSPHLCHPLRLRP